MCGREAFKVLNSNSKLVGNVFEIILFLGFNQLLPSDRRFVIIRIKNIFYSKFKIFSGWKKWMHSDAPARDGVFVGVNEYNEECYIGRALVNGRQLAIGKLLIESKTNQAGLYLEYGNVEHYIASGIEYYAKEPTCDYEWVSSSNGQVVRNAVQFSSDSYTFYPGRAFLQGSIQVGKVTLEHQVMYYGWGGVARSTGSYEVLTCNKIKTTTPSVTTTTSTQSPQRNCLNDEMQTLNDELLALNTKLSTKLENQIAENQRISNEHASCKTNMNDKLAEISRLNDEKSSSQIKLKMCEAKVASFTQY